MAFRVFDFSEIPIKQASHRLHGRPNTLARTNCQSSKRRRRMMSVRSHDRIAGRPARTKVLEEFIVYAQNNPGVVFMRKDAIARFALGNPQTIREGI
jgi:hypothetical protein